jgi:hypothetical protein
MHIMLLYARRSSTTNKTEVADVHDGMARDLASLSQ